MISEVTIDSSAAAEQQQQQQQQQQLSLDKVVCGGDDEPVPAVVPMSEDEDGSDSEEGYSSMSDDDDGSDSEEALTAAAAPQQQRDAADETLDRHSLYLPCPTSSVAYSQPIVFSGGMDAEECDEYYRSLDEAAEAAAQREAAAAEKQQAAASPRKRSSPLFRRIRRNSSSKKIKSDDDSSVASSTSYHSAQSSSSSSGARSTVTFNDSVTVQPVFTIDHFDDEIWDNTWTPRRAVKEGKKRAKLEFRYDGCDWREATEEDGMFRDPRTGRLEHPVHYYDDDFECRGGSSRNDEVVQMCLIMPGRRC